jgi:hypothetical protein
MPATFVRMHSGMEAPAPARSQRRSPEQPVLEQDHRWHGCDGHCGGRQRGKQKRCLNFWLQTSMIVKFQAIREREPSPTSFYYIILPKADNICFVYMLSSVNFKRSPIFFNFFLTCLLTV